MRIIIDMNLSPSWETVLAEAGHDVAHWARIGPAKTPDSEIMTFARMQGFVVLTKDLDFGEMLALNGDDGPSVIQLRGGDSMPGVGGSEVLDILDQFSEQIETGALVTIGLSRARVRLLPIKRAPQ